MFEINYYFTEHISQDDQIYLLADDMDLRYSLFLGSVRIKSGKQAINMDWNWIPLLDLAYAFLKICLDLLGKSQSERTFDFTESTECIYFNKNGVVVQVSTSFSDVKIDVNYEDLFFSVWKFYSEVIDYLTMKYPELTRNSHFIPYTFSQFINR